MAKKVKTTAPKASASAIADLFGMTIKNVERVSGNPMYLLNEVSLKYGVRRVLSTGYPSLDMALNQADNSNERGFPYGRVIELHGESQAGKSTVCNLLAARNIALGGLTYWITTEFDFSTRYINQFLEAENLEPIQEGKKGGHPFAVAPAMTVKELFHVVKGIVEPLLEAAKAIEASGKNPLTELPPVLIVCDSLAAMMAGVNMSRKEKDWDDSDQMGSHAKELHDFFKFFLGHFARLGIMFVFTNHYRAYLQNAMSRKTKQPAHDGIIKYYSTLRIGMQRGYNATDLNKTTTRLGQAYDIGYPVKFGIYKMRGEWVLDGEIIIDYYHGYGYDYLKSLIDAYRMAGLVEVRNNGKSYSFLIPDDGILQEKVGTEPRSIGDLKKFLNDNLEIALELEDLTLKLGPKKIDDLRLK